METNFPASPLLSEAPSAPQIGAVDLPKTVTKVLTATSENGKLHLGWGPENSLGHKLGEFITLLPRYTVGIGVTFKVGGKEYRASEKNMQKHLSSIGIVEPDAVKKVEGAGYERLIRENEGRIQVLPELMVTSLSNVLRQKKSDKMIQALLVNAMDRVKHLALEGAHLDRTFTFNDDPTHYTIYTATSYAVAKRYQDLARFIYGLRKTVSGDRVEKKEITYQGSPTPLHKEVSLQLVEVNDKGEFSLK